MSEEIKYVLESLRFKTSIYRDQKKRNLTFNDDVYYSNILNEYIEDLQQENQQLKEQLIKLEDKYIHNVPCCNEEDCDLFKEHQLYKTVLDEIREYIEKQIKFLCEIDGQNIPLNDSFKFCSMNELYQTGKYSGFKEVQEKLEEILDKVNKYD